MEAVRKFTKYWLETRRVLWTPALNTSGIIRQIPLPIHLKIRDYGNRAGTVKWPMKFVTRTIYLGQTYEVSIDLEERDCRLVRQNTYIIRNDSEISWPE